MKVTIDEDQFRIESKKLASLLADPEIEVRIPMHVISTIFIFCCLYSLAYNVL